MNEVDKTTQPKPFESNEEKQNTPMSEDVQEAKTTFGEVEDESLPKWLKRTENGNLICKTNDGEFEFTDIPYKKIISAKKRATRRQADGTEYTDMDTFEMILISESLVKPQMGEMQIKELRGSTVMKLRATIYKLYDIASFLSI